ncbi:MAG: choice-of-anchor D domain-containing protein, partial [Terriglobales bacterium]
SATLTNTGTATVTISAATVTGAGFALGSGAPAFPLAVAAGQSATLPVRFAPTASGTASGTLSVGSDASNGTVAVTLAGTGASPIKGPLASGSASVSFGNVQVGQSATASVVLTNTGTATVTISAATVTGAGFALGSSAPALPLAVAAGQSATLPVRFAPTTSGTASGTLSVGSDASNGTVAVTLTGTGETQHTVVLNWTPSVSPATAYKVYRGQISGGPFTLVSTSLLTSPTFTDVTVADGQTYFYVVTAVDSQGIESAYSNQVQVSIPSP